MRWGNAMPVTTKQEQHSNTVTNDSFAKQLGSMLGGMSTQKKNQHTKIARRIQPGQVSVEEVIQQANDGISLAQIIDVTMQQAGDMLAQLYYRIEAASQDSATNYVQLNKAICAQMTELSNLFAGVTFQQQNIFQSPTSHRIPTGINKDDRITLQIPNTSLNQLGTKTWQLIDGPILPICHNNQLSFAYNNLTLEPGQRVRLMLGEADVLQECLGDLHTTMQTVADLINQAELDWLHQAMIENGSIGLMAQGVDKAKLSIEAPAVSVEDSLAMLQVPAQEHAQQALQVIIGAINILADYRDIAISVSNELFQAVNGLMTMPKSDEINVPLADALVKDVQNMFAQQPTKSVMAQANLED